MLLTTCVGKHGYIAVQAYLLRNVYSWMHYCALFTPTWGDAATGPRTGTDGRDVSRRIIRHPDRDAADARCRSHEDGSSLAWREGAGDGAHGDDPDARAPPGCRRLQYQVELAISRVLSRVIIHLGVVSPQRSSDLPGNSADRTIVPLFGLAPGGVYRATECCHRRGALLPHPFTLTVVRHDADRSEDRPVFMAARLGGLLSAALAVGSRPPGVTPWRLVLWSPDFPPQPLRIQILSQALQPTWSPR